MLKKYTLVTLVFLLGIPFAGRAQNTPRADSLYHRGIEFYESGNYRKAEFYLKKAYRLSQKNASPNVWLKPGLDYAEILVSRAKYEHAFKLFIKLKKAARRPKNDEILTQIENDLGWAYSKTGQTQKALTHYKRALPLARQINDSLRLGYIYDNIGGIYRDRGNYERSLRYRKKALAYLQKLNQPEDVSITLNNIGRVYEDLYLYDKAIDFYRRSLAIRKKEGNVFLLASAYNNIAGLYKKMGDFNKALINFNKSLKFSKQAGTPSRTATSLNNIGTLYHKLGQAARALEYYRESLQLKKSFAGPASLATTYSNIGNRLEDLNRHKEALTYYRRALELRKKAGNPRMTGRSLLDLARAEKNFRQFSQSQNYLRRARALADSTRDLSLRRETASLGGELAFARKNYVAARNHFKHALTFSQSLEKGARIEPLINLSTAYNELDSDSTLIFGRRAITLIESQRSRAPSLSRLKAGYFEGYSHFYVSMAGWMLKYKNDKSTAFRLAELAKARTLTDRLIQAAKHIDKSLPENLRIKRAQQISDISALHMRLKHTSDHKKRQKLKRNIRRKDLAYTSFENHLHQKYPQYKKLNPSKPVSLRSVQQMCGAETAVLEYAVTDGNIVSFFITNNNIEARQILLSNDSATGDSAGPRLSKKVAQFRRAILTRASEDSIRALSKPLYDYLIAPFEHELASYKNIIIVPDGPLAYLPFAALSHHHRYLIRRFNFKYTPSMTVYKLTPAPVRYDTTKLLAIAHAAGSRRAHTADLPTADLETKAISRLFSHTTLLEGSRTTEQQVKKLLQKNYSYIHIAAHSTIDEQHSSLSGIVLGNSNSSRGIGNDGYLRSNEIYNLNIHCDLVVLSACKSGVGQLISGEGMLGLQRAFFIAGTSTVVVSLWDVYDRPTTRLMESFYKTLLGKRSNSWWSYWHSFTRWIGWNHSVPFGTSASAMRAAKLHMLNSPRYHHPVYWAPFIVVGR